MRVLAVTNIYPNSQYPSAGIFIQQQIKGLTNIGVEVDVLVLDRLQKGMRAYWGLGAKVRRRMEDFKPDVVHCMYGGIMAQSVARAVSDKPVVITFHGSDLLGENLSGLLRKLISMYGVWASKRAAQQASGVVLVSSALKEYITSQVDPSKIRIIPCGIDLEIFKPLKRDMCCEQLGWDPDVFHILFYYSSDPVKRPALAYASVKALEKRGVRAQLHELRNVPYHEVPLWLNGSGALLLTSLHEGSPTIVKEALSCDVPVVSVDVGDVAERIKGIEGCYLARALPDDLADKLSAVSSGSGKVNGRGSVQSLSLENIAVQLKQFYQEIR